MTIRIIKLMTKEEIIGDVVEGTEGVITVENPMVMVPFQDEKKQVRINFIPYAPFADGSKQVIGIYPHAVAADYMPADDIANHYRSSFGSGIQIVPSMQGIIK